jgi:hypothetical protein
MKCEFLLPLYDKDNVNTKLCDDDILEIHYFSKIGATLESLASAYDVTENYMRRILAGRCRRLYEIPR